VNEFKFSIDYLPVQIALRNILSSNNDFHNNAKINVPFDVTIGRSFFQITSLTKFFANICTTFFHAIVTCVLRSF